MAPSQKPNHGADAGLMHTELKRYGGLRLSRSNCVADGADVGLCELGVLVLDASGDSLRTEPIGMPVPSQQAFGVKSGAVSIAGSIASLCNHVSDVVQIRSQEEVGGIATCRIVAAMEDAESGRDVPESQCPRDAMRSAVGSEPELTVSVLESARQPRPALARSLTVNPRPEPFDARLPVSHVAPLMRVVRGRCGVGAPSGPAYFSRATLRVGSVSPCHTPGTIS